MTDFKELINIETWIRYAAVFAPGIIISVYLSSFLIGAKLADNLWYLFFNNSSLFIFSLIILIFIVGAYIYLFSLNLATIIFKGIFPKGIEDKNQSHNYWRHFSISISLTLILILIVDLFMKSKFFIILLFLCTVAACIMTVILHHDIKIKNIKTDKPLWNIEWARKNYYSYEGLKAIIENQDINSRK